MRVHHCPLPFLLEEFHDDRRDSFGPGNQEQMPVVDDVQLGVGNSPRQHAHVDQRDQRVVVAGQHQGRLVDLVQPVDAGPAEASEQLPVVAQLARRADLAGMFGGEVGIAAERAAINQGAMRITWEGWM